MTAAPLIYFVRHGQTDWNAEGRLQGQADTDINETGRGQADRNGRRLAELISNPEDFDFIASPLRRTRETMERVRRAMGLDPRDYATDPRLKEVHFGDWQGFTFAELEAREKGSTQPRMADKWGYRPPGDAAENYEMMRTRVKPWFTGLVRPTVCVTHGGIIRVIITLVSGMPEREAAALDIVQDRVLKVSGTSMEWL